jgi:hypothetical protein
VKDEEVDHIILEVLSFFEEMTFEMIVLDWPAFADDVRREELEAALGRLKACEKITERETEQGPGFLKKFPKKHRTKKWGLFK